MLRSLDLNLILATCTRELLFSSPILLFSPQLFKIIYIGTKLPLLPFLFSLFSFYFVVIQEYPVVHGLYHILFPPFTHPYKCFFFRLFHLLISSMVSVFLVSRCSDANLIDIPVEVETPDRHYYHV